MEQEERQWECCLIAMVTWHAFLRDSTWKQHMEVGWWQRGNEEWGAGDKVRDKWPELSGAKSWLGWNLLGQ